MATALLRPQGLLALGMIALLGLVPSLGQEPPSKPGKTPTRGKEYEVKAAVLYKLGRFVTWPASAFQGSDAPFTLASVGKNPFDDILANMVTGKRITNRPPRVQHFDGPSDLAPCQILFVTAEALTHMPTLRRRARAEHILTVGETEDFLEQGGMVHMAVVDDRLRLSINVAEAAEADLRISASLLRISHRVVQETVP